MTTGPFYAFQYEPSAWVTIGGIRTNDRLQAIDGEGVAIPGLYVAGADNGTLMSAPYCDYEGYSLMCAYCGRPSGRAVRRRDDRRVSGNGVGPACGIARMPGRSTIIQSDGAHAFSPLPPRRAPFNRPGLRRPGGVRFRPSSSGSASVR